METDTREIILEQYVIQYSRKGADDWFDSEHKLDTLDSARAVLRGTRKAEESGGRHTLGDSAYQFRIVKRTTCEEVV